MLLVVLVPLLMLRASLPQLDGRLNVEGLQGKARIERDALGTPTIIAEARNDLAFATGFAHAQDRFFQMDLMRRAAAGELAQLLGEALIDADRSLRIHGFRRVAGALLAAAEPAEQALLTAYAQGVNSALQQARAWPWEYRLLREQPALWREEDSLLVAFSMYLDLNDATGGQELQQDRLRASLPAPLLAFIAPLGTEWDAPISGSPVRATAIPGPEVIDLRAGAARAAAMAAPRNQQLPEQDVFIGSNSWAVAASHTADGGALLANDMHLGLRLPHVWYRARLVVDAEEAQRRDLVGVTLPGLPLLIAGSNGQVAWGFTNSYGDWTDLVIVESDSADAGRYLTAEGSEPFQIDREVIAVRGAADETLEVRRTRWGAVIGEDAAGNALALAWTAHRPAATNLGLWELEAVATVPQALLAANRAGTPVQNFVAADSAGSIGWTLMGQVPIRGEYDATVPNSWREPGSGWQGWRTPEEYPQVIDPATGRLWTANSRIIDVESWLAFMGDGGYDLGARGAQIRDSLFAIQSATAQDMADIQHDSRALFLTRWRDLLLDLLDESALADAPLRAQARDLIEHWSAAAAVDDVGYRLVRAMRLQIRQDVFDTLIAPARERFPGASFNASAQFEAPLWQLVTQQPLHLLDPRHASWREALLHSMDIALARLQEECAGLQDCTWGARNTLNMSHPMSLALPWAARWLDMPAVPLPGDSDMPRVQGPTVGASQRLVVSPGREDEGWLQVPGGPTDHPLSPFYGAGHDAWAEGRTQPLLPGEARHVLELLPQ